MINNFRAPEGKKVLLQRLEKSGRYSMFLPEQKNITLMKDFESHFTRSEDGVMYPFSGNFATGKACIWLKKH